MQHYSTDQLDIQPVDENSLIPLYQQVRIDLMRILQSERVRIGEMLPTEKDLAQAYHVSRQTIRQAIGLLESQHLLERTPGRGTTVVSPVDRHTFFLDQSFAKQISDMGLIPRSEVLRKKISTIDESATKALLNKKDCPALELIRLRFGGDSPIGIQYTTVITDLCPNLHTYDFQVSSLYDLLLNQYKIAIARIDQTVSAAIPDEWHKKLLKVNDSTPLLCVNTVAYLENNDPIEASTSYYRADKYEFSITKRY